MATKKSKVPWNIDTSLANEPFVADPNFLTSGDNAGALTLSTRQLTQMSNHELMDRVAQIDEQATLMIWRILWVIRQRFESDKLFGQYIEDYRSTATHGTSVGSQQSVNTAWLAGRFCETYKIYDLLSVNIPKSAIYELSRPMNEGVVGAVFDEIRVKKERVLFSDVKRLLSKARSVSSANENGGDVDRDSSVRTCDITSSDCEERSFEPESNVEVIDYDEVEEIDSVIEVANEEDDDETLEEIVTSIKKHHLSSSSVRVLIYRLNKLLEEM